jgi:hypothetical protein
VTDCITAQTHIVAKKTFVDGCPVDQKLRCHEVQMGQYARLQWVMKDRSGNPVDLSSCFPAISASESDSQDFDAAGDLQYGVTLRLRELSGMDPNTDGVFSVAVDIVSDSVGEVLSAPLPTALVRDPGIYLEEWGVFDREKRLLFSNQCFCFVTRGLFGISEQPAEWNVGPPTLSEIQLSLRDSDPTENPLLDNIEFDAAEIAQAVTRSLSYWNESSPPLRPFQTTKTFPFKELWLRGIQAYLFEIAANHYRRNHLPYAAGGMQIDDKNKEQSYAVMASRLMQDFRDAVAVKKVEINTQLFTGWSASPYVGRFY